MSAQQDKLASILGAALELATPAERAAYLDAACGSDQQLRAEVEQLLQHDEAAGSFLNRPARPGLVATVDEASVTQRPGTMIGPYKLLQQIGGGGMGTVFMAEQTQPVRRKVAVKVIKAGMDSKQVIARFEAERQALAMMDHVNIARVLDAGATEAGLPYFVMELVHGVPITRYCDDNRLTPRERLELFVPVCQAIQHAHQKGIIHRDVKPSNIMITLYDGKPVPKVIDFGVAKATEQKLTERTLFTQYGVMVGTLEYMSPEQAEMSALGVDTRSDIFSLGVLLYQLLTGSTPLSHKRVREAAYGEILRMIREEEPPRPSARLSASGAALASIAAQRHMEPAKLTKLVRGELDWIVMKTLEKDRNRRYETASALAADVQRYLHDEPVLAFPPSAWYRLWKIARRHKGPVLAVALVMLALVGGIIGTTWSMLRATDARADAVNEAAQKEHALTDTKAALAAARQSERGADQRLFESYLAQARANRLSRRAGQRFESLDILQRATQLARTLDLPAEKFHELRNAAIATLALPDLYLAGPWNDWPADASMFDFDEAHAIYARTDQQGSCSIRRVADDTELHRLPAPGAPASPFLSRDGRFVAVYHWPKRLDLWKLDEGPARRILSEKSVQFVDFHRDGQQVALAYNDGAIGLFELASGRQLSRLAPDTAAREVVIALHPTEPLVAICSYFSPAVQLREVRTGQVLASLPKSTQASSVAWHPDGRTLAVGYGESMVIRLYHRTTLQPYRTLESEMHGLYLTFNHAGDRLAATGWNGFLELFDVGTGQKLFATTPMWWRCHPFSRDDRRLAGAVQHGKLGIWQVGDGREYRTLLRKALPEKEDYASVAVSRDGRLLAASTTDGFGLWDLASGSELAFIPGGDLNNLVLFEPSGALLTLSTAGLSRWPIAKELNAAGELSIGPSKPLPLPGGSALGQSRDGRVIVTCDRAVGAQQAYAGGWILHADRPNQPIRLDPGADISSIAVSPDGRWVVTVRHAVGLAKIWDARDGRLVKQLAEWGTGYPRFSPDGRWLSTHWDGGRLFAVDIWEPGPRVGGIGVFAPDSKLMAIPTTAGMIRLVDPATGRELAMLENPNLDGSYLPVFTPDGTKLIGYSNGKVKGIHVWDLRLFRQHLAEMDLDWDAPPYPPADPGSTTAQPLKVEVRLGDPATVALTREQKTRQDIVQYRRLVEASPHSAEACNSLAWVYLTAPEALRDMKAAVPLAEKAVRLAPGNAMCRNTLGMAYYRAGRYREAVEILRPNLDSQEDWALAFDLYFLAMSHHRLGETARARDYYALAVRWTRPQPGLSAELLEVLTVFQAEAEELLKQESGTKNQASEKKKKPD